MSALPRWEGAGLLTSRRRKRGIFQICAFGSLNQNCFIFRKAGIISSCVCNDKYEMLLRTTNTWARSKEKLLHSKAVVVSTPKYYIRLLWWAHSMTSVLWWNLAAQYNHQPTDQCVETHWLLKLGTLAKAWKRWKDTMLFSITRVALNCDRICGLIIWVKAN